MQSIRGPQASQRAEDHWTRRGCQEWAGSETTSEHLATGYILGAPEGA